MKFTPRSETTRQFIIESTAAVFNKKGFAGTSLSDLTGVTKLTKGSIYGNFENKEAVALAVFDHNVAKRSALLQEAIEKEGTYQEKLMVYARVFAEKAKMFCAEGGCPYLNAGTEADDTHEQMREHVAGAMAEWKRSIVQLINSGKKAGEFKSETDSAKTAIRILALLEGGIFLSNLTKNNIYMNTTGEAIAELIGQISA